MKSNIQTQEKESLFKEVMGSYPTGVTIVTTSDEKRNPAGLTVNSFASLSLNPLLILWAIDHKVSSLDVFKKAGGFVVHILAGDQQDLCKTFASKNVDKFGECNWNFSQENLPLLSDTFATLQCKTYNQIEAGDHTILIGEVKDIQIDKQKSPMLYHKRHFGSIPTEFYQN